MHLLWLSSEAQLNLEVIILEPRDFNRPGPGGCNKCAGILSSNLIQNMARIGLTIPEEVIQAVIDRYILNIDHAQLPLHSQNSARRIVSVYRGAGPRLNDGLPLPASFDGWLLAEAQKRGARLIKAHVRAVRAAPRPLVFTTHEEIQADLVIMATGVNSRSPLDLAWGYEPPLTETMAQDEIRTADRMLENGVHIFLEKPAGLIFGALIPKGRYTNLSLLGHGLPADAVSQFLEAHGMETLAQDKNKLLCGCSPRIAISTARGYYADRLVVVGDAAVTRLYKDGIGSAFITAEAAARTAIFRGVSRQDFLAGYHPACQRIAADNLFGRLLFRLWSLIFHIPLLRKSWTRSIRNEGNQSGDQRIHTRVLWGVFTGDDSYRNLFWMSVSFPALKHFLFSIFNFKDKR